ncbi:integrase, catalytic region, zinc finger, CCHC-type containing protein, partial [Tanacetum coccineum]
NTYQSSYNNPQLQQQFLPSQYGSIHPNQHYSSTYPSQPQFNHSPVQSSYPYQSQMNHQTSYAPQIAYQSPQVSTQPMIESPLVDSGFVVPVFSLGDDPIACLSTNNQLRNLLESKNPSYNSRWKVPQLATIQWKDNAKISGTGYKNNATSSGGNNACGEARVVKCSNSWYKDKAMLAGQILDEEQLTFLVDLGVLDGCLDCSLVSRLRMFETYDREPLSTHELSLKTKSWLWHRRLSHLNFGTLIKLAKDGLARGIPRLKFQKDHLCSACALGKSKKSSHQPKAKDTNQEKLYLFHMDLCGLMHVASINGKRAINTTCYTQNRSLIRRQYNKTPYELIQDKKPDLSFFHVFGALCYPSNDNDDHGKVDAKADIGIFVGYVAVKKAFRIYNKRTQKIIETIHVTFDELIAMAFKQFSSGPELHSMTPATSSSGLTPNTVS